MSFSKVSALAFENKLVGFRFYENGGGATDFDLETLKAANILIPKSNVTTKVTLFEKGDRLVSKEESTVPFVLVTDGSGNPDKLMEFVGRHPHYNRNIRRVSIETIAKMVAVVVKKKQAVYHLPWGASDSSLKCLVVADQGLNLQSLYAETDFSDYYLADANGDEVSKHLHLGVLTGNSYEASWVTENYLQSKEFVLLNVPSSVNKDTCINSLFRNEKKWVDGWYSNEWWY